MYGAKEKWYNMNYLNKNGRKDGKEDRDATNSITVITETVWKYNK